MLELPEEVTLLHVPANREVRAALVKLTRELAAKQMGSVWWQGISKSSRKAEDDFHWPWPKIIGSYKNDKSVEALAVQTDDGAVQGGMIYRIDAKSQLDKGEGAVYIDRLAVAPRNRHWLADPPLYRGVGTALLLAAVRHSYTLGLQGRVSLTSLPSERTQDYYRRRGMQSIFEDEDGMIYELPVPRATEWLTEQGYL